MHWKKIRTAICALGGGGSSEDERMKPNPPTKAAPSMASPRRKSALPPGKRFRCFLSHHKQACAMEARFLKDKLQGMLDGEVFLDSDDLFGKAT